MIRAKHLARRSSSIVFLLAAGCTVGPKYQRPSVPVPAKWEVTEPWRESAPKDGLPKGEWWNVFQNEELNDLEQQTLDANQTIKVATAHVEKARASADLQIATQFPSLSATPSAQRQRLSGNRPANSNFPVRTPVSQTNIVLPFTVGYETDLFGRRRRSIEAAQASYQASAADLENVRLVITAELAGDYFTLRQLDTELGILNRTVETLKKGLQLVDSRHRGGVASGLDVAEEETLLNTTKTQAVLLQQQRKQFEDAIAVLVGKPAPDFHLAPKELNAEPPRLDAGLPSELLERRPDIAEAERQMAVANAQIGIARAAYFPSLNLFANGGWQAADIAKLLNVQSTFWAVGANAAEAIFTGGSRPAQTQFAKAGYNASVASYRDTVLNAFREVEDDVNGLIVFDQAFHSQEQAVDSSRRTLDIATSRYVGGLVNYLDVVNAQQNLLNNEQELAVIRGQRLATSVLLIKALGGGWDASSLATVQVKTKLKDAIAP
ncbi:MAG TPA: efflux transporter outer membrane subunit [Candidatus Dormibacteraeota bacterium]|nr:efflux transporter outer membrane subunit [Candidatus Dormibacteraeota bacterium]